MLDGWYCRSIANMQASEAASASNNEVSQPAARDTQEEYSSDSSSEGTPEPTYRSQYLTLKKKLKYLIYENECFQDALRSSQKRLLKVSRDRSFLLNRLLRYEKHDSTTSESEDTESSDDTDYQRIVAVKRKKVDMISNHQNVSNSNNSSANKSQSTVKKKRAVIAKKSPNTAHHIMGGQFASKASSALGLSLAGAGDGHMTPEEVERHLQSRQSYLELLPAHAPPTVPTEMFSNDPSLDSESNDVLENSPNVEEWFD